MDDDRIEPTGDDPFGDLDIENFTLDGIEEVRKLRYSIMPDANPKTVDNLVEAAKDFRDYVDSQAPPVDGVPAGITVLSMGILEKFIVNEFADMIGMPRRASRSLAPLAMTAFIYGICVAKNHPEWSDWYLNQFPGEMAKMSSDASVSAWPLSIPEDEEKI